MPIDYLNVTSETIPLYLEKANNLAIEVFGERIRGEIDSLIEMHGVMLSLAIEGDELVGFKIGFCDVPKRFYSCTGGVSPGFRGRGVGSHLMDQQHKWCFENGYKAIRTETKNEFAPMISLNLRHGFRIIGTYTDHRGEPKIILEKAMPKAN